MNHLTGKSIDFNLELIVKDDMTALRGITGRLSRYPEVESICISRNDIPCSEGCSGASLRFPDNDTAWISTVDHRVTPRYYKVSRFWDIGGSGHESLVKALKKNTIIVPVDVTDYYPDVTFYGRDFLGKGARMNDTNFRIAALTEPVRYDRYNIAKKPFIGTYIGTYFPDEQTETVENVIYLELSLRVREGTGGGFVERLMDDANHIYQVENVYMLDVTPLSRVRTASEIDNDNELRTQFRILFFLLLSISLGVTGTF